MGWGLPKLNVVSKLQDASHKAQKGVGNLVDSGRKAVVTTGEVAVKAATSDEAKFWAGKGTGALGVLYEDVKGGSQWVAGGAADTAKGTAGWLGGQASTLKWFPIILIAGAGLLLYSVRGEVGKTARAVIPGGK
jgi:hypothetical protein